LSCFSSTAEETLTPGKGQRTLISPAQVSGIGFHLLAFLF